MGNMRFKVGDRVRIKSIDWYNENKSKSHGTVVCDGRYFDYNMREWCGKTLTIQSIGIDFYLMEEDNLGYEFTDEMIEGLVEEEVDLIPKFGEFSDNESLDIQTMTTDFIKEHGFPCPNGYIFKDENGNVINATKIVLEKKKKQYPKTYEECYKIMGVKLSDCYIQGYKSPLLEDLQELFICRDAYWKIAGEEMGLGKPWEPDCNSGYFIPSIIYRSGFIQKVEVQYRNAILSFPTPEMRDAFYENFKELIEQCKELL